MAQFTRFVSLVLLVVMLVLFLTGLAMLYGTWLAWVFDLHRIAGFAFVALIPWKARIVARSLSRRLRRGWRQVPGILVSTVLAGGVLLVAALGLMWLWRLGPYGGPLGQTVVAWHWILGLSLIPLFAVHVVQRWRAPRRADFTARRSVLRLLGLGAVGIAGWWGALILARARATEARPRRAVTGSRGFGDFTGNAYPVTGEGLPDVDIDRWRLRVDGAVADPVVLTYADVLAMVPDETDAAVDCTSGWYSVQAWRGVALPRLLALAGVGADTVGREAAGVRLFSVSDYNHTFTMSEAQTILLATHVTGEVLDARHGCPLRAVVPDRRGWFWVKWVVRIEVLDDPLEVTAAVIAAPRQVLRQL